MFFLCSQPQSAKTVLCQLLFLDNYLVFADIHSLFIIFNEALTPVRHSSFLFLEKHLIMTGFPLGAHPPFSSLIVEFSVGFSRWGIEDNLLRAPEEMRCQIRENRSFLLSSWVLFTLILR